MNEKLQLYFQSLEYDFSEAKFACLLIRCTAYGEIGIILPLVSVTSPGKLFWTSVVDAQQRVLPVLDSFHSLRLHPLGCEELSWGAGLLSLFVCLFAPHPADKWLLAGCMKSGV